MARTAHAASAGGNPFPRSRAVVVVLALAAVLLGLVTSTATGHGGRPAPAAVSGVGAGAVYPGHVAEPPHNLRGTAGAEDGSRTGAPTEVGARALDTEGETAAPNAVHDVVDDVTRDARRGRAPPGVSRDFPGEPHHAHVVDAVFTPHVGVSRPGAATWPRSSSSDPAGPTSYPPLPPGRAPPSPPGT